MGFFDRFTRRRAGANPVGELDGVLTSWRGQQVILDIQKLSPAQMYDSQPHLRTVIDFLARHIAHVGVHSYQRVDETDRVRDRTSAFAKVMRRPNGEMTGFELIYATIADLGLYDECLWYVHADDERADGAGYSITWLPQSWCTPIAGDAFRRKGWKVQAPGGDAVEIPAAECLHFHGYHPEDMRKGSTPINALKAILQEQLQSSNYRQQVWKNGGRVSAVLTRPAGAPRWSPEARNRFRDDWYAAYTGNGSRAGGTPILDDGMTMQKLDFSAKDQQFVEGSKLSFQTCCSVYHINPTMVGLLDNANFANVREFRRALYGDTLGPVLERIEQRLTIFLLPMLGMDDESFYAEFNIGEKLQGDFIEQAQVLQTAVGGPYMLRSEARSRLNLPSVTGADELIVPMNVTVGGQASPTDSGSQNLGPNAEASAEERTARKATNPPVLRLLRGAKAAAKDERRDEAAKKVRAFFERQERVVKTALGVKADGEWWDEERWDEELADDLYDLAFKVAGEVGAKTAAELGFTADDYDPEKTVAFLQSVAMRLATSINAVTKGQIDEALQGEDPALGISLTFTVAKDQRSGAIGGALVATAAGFGTVEAAQQVTADDEEAKVTKTWETGPNPRPSHARMNGETVGIDETFSNGAQWPADMTLDADESAGCNCSVSINVG